MSPYKGCYIQEHMVIVVMDLPWVGYVICLIQFVSYILVLMASRADNTVPLAQLEQACSVNYDSHLQFQFKYKFYVQIGWYSCRM